MKNDQKTVTAHPGQNVTLPCRAPNNNIIVVEWSRPDQEPEYVLLYRDEQFVPDEQNLSFANRVDLQDRQMKDGDVSLILKNVTPADNGTYECRVVMRETNRRKRAHLKTEPICIIQLSVVPPGHIGGQEKDEVHRRHLGLVAAVLLFVVIIVAAIVITIKQRNSHSPPPPDEEADHEMVVFSVSAAVESSSVTDTAHQQHGQNQESCKGTRNHVKLFKCCCTELDSH